MLQDIVTTGRANGGGSHAAAASRPPALRAAPTDDVGRTGGGAEAIPVAAAVHPSCWRSAGVTVDTSRAPTDVTDPATADAGMSTVEYAVGTVVAAAFAAVLYKIVTGDSVVTGLTDLINSALSTTF